MKLGSLLAAARLLRDRRRLLRSGLFDPDWYRRQVHHLLGRLFPALHFLLRGEARNLDPNPYFQTAWYDQENPDVRRGGANPLLHYLYAGAREGRDPNPFFSSAYYLAAYPGVAEEGANPLAHFIRHGAREGRRPSPRFDPEFYKRQLGENDPGRDEPLRHFLTQGRREGLSPAAKTIEGEGEPVEWARLSEEIRWSAGMPRRTALFVTHAPDGQVRAHALWHAEVLVALGWDVVMIVASDLGLRAPVPEIGLAGLYVRENVGFDFAAWAHLFKVLPKLWDADGVLLVNDSVIGPLDPGRYAEILDRVRSSPADLVALTESREHGWHLQSYFLHLGRNALANARLQAFFNAVRTLSDKQAVIDRYELALTGAALQADMRVEALHRNATVLNPTLYRWRELLEAGHPFLKASVALGRHEDVDAAGWREALTRFGYDLSRVEPLFHPSPRAELLSLPKPIPEASPGVFEPRRRAFYGPWNFDNGLGEASRGYLSALWRAGGEINLHALKQPFHIHRRRSGALDVRDFVQAADVAIVHLNPDGWHLLTTEQRREIDRARIRIGLWVWEMSELPDVFRPNFEAVDVIWTPSRYCAEMFARATDRPVQVVPHVVPIPAAPIDCPAAERMILYAFDGSSYLVRKNPVALVEAFARSGLHRRGWTLVLKTKNLGDQPELGEGLRRLCGETAAVRLIDQALARPELNDLFARCAVYASPHASEGFGLTIAEAMAASKLVVATDYGGPRDFLDAACGFPVPFRLKALGEDHGHYRSGGEWAQVDPHGLTEALISAADAFEVGDASLGRAARARIAERFSADAVARAVDQALVDLVPNAGTIERRRRPVPAP